MYNKNVQYDAPLPYHKASRIVLLIEQIIYNILEINCISISTLQDKDIIIFYKNIGN